MHIQAVYRFNNIWEKNEGGKIYRNGEGMGQLWATTFKCYCYWKIMEIKSARSVAPL